MIIDNNLNYYFKRVVLIINFFYIKGKNNYLFFKKYKIEKIINFSII